MRIVASEWLSLDGVVQAPVDPAEDRSGGFAHAGWHPRYFDQRSTAWLTQTVTGAAGYLFGRGTYAHFATHWPTASADEQALAEPLNSRPKWVLSSTLTDPLPWGPAEVLPGVDAVAKLLTGEPAGDDEDGYLLAVGSPGLVRSLAEADLVDEYRLMIDPLLLGSGKRLFGDLTAPRPLRLLSIEPTTTGATLATYARESAPDPG